MTREEVFADAEKWSERIRFQVLFGCQIAFAFNALFAVFAYYSLFRLSIIFNDWRAMLAYPVIMLCWPLRRLWIPPIRNKK